MTTFHAPLPFASGFSTPPGRVGARAALTRLKRPVCPGSGPPGDPQRGAGAPGNSAVAAAGPALLARFLGLHLGGLHD